MVRVRVHLRLPEPGKAENVIQVVRLDDEGNAVSFPAVAYAKSLVLENVRPVIEEDKRSRIAGGEARKMPCGYLEGDLVAWDGRFRDKADPALKKEIEDIRMKDLFKEVADYDRILKQGPRIGFNPKKFRQFYEVPSDGDSVTMAFEQASCLVVCHWHYAAQDVVFKPMEKSDIEKKPAKKSQCEKDSLRRGMATTCEKLASLGMSL